jgi:uncharacterized membrane protein YfcA
VTIVEIVLLAGMIVLLGHLIKGVTGFASALFSIPLLALFLDIKFVVPVFLLFDLVSGLILTLQNRRLIDRKSALLILSGLVVGTAAGTYFLLSFANQELKRIFGVLVILFALKLLLWDNREARKLLSRAWAPVAGIVGGCTGAMFGLNGPPLVLYLTRQLSNKKVFRATLYGLFFADACYRLALYSYNGLITSQVIKFALYLTPFILVGLVLGSKLQGRIGEKLFRGIVSLILLITGALLAI